MSLVATLVNTKQLLPTSVQEGILQVLDQQSPEAMCGPCFGVGEPAEGNRPCVIKLKWCWHGNYFFKLWKQ